MSAGHPFPTARWVALAWLAVYLPTYALAYGVMNFLFLCNLSVILFCAGLWRGSALLVSSQAVGVLVVDLAWILDAGSRVVTGRHWIGGTEYLWDPRWPLHTRLLSLYHAAMPLLLLWAVRRTGYDRRGLGLQSAIAAAAILLGRLQAPQANLNFAWSAPIFHRPLGPAPQHLLLSIATLLVVAYVPTHLALSRLFGRATPRGGAGPRAGVVAALALALLAAPLDAGAEDGGSAREGPSVPRPRSVVLMIGDGMGIGQVGAALIAAGGALRLERAAAVGLSKTGSADALVTDSAAAATAMASGVKTRNGAVGVDAQGHPVPTLLERAERDGLRTGMVVTSSVTDATPAAFAAHVPSRKSEEEIAAEMARSGVDVMIGGGRRFFARRSDGRNLLEDLRREGTTVVESAAGLWGLEGTGAAGTPARLVALLADEDLPSERRGRGDLLPRATEIALERLGRGGAAFFLLVEGSQIDWEAHAHRGPAAAAEVVDFDAAIGRALDFAARDGHTLVVVTADHETGGMAVRGGSPASRTFEAGFTTRGHTAAPVPVFAFGPGAEAFSGVYENVEIFRKLVAALALSP